MRQLTALTAEIQSGLDDLISKGVADPDKLAQ